MIFKIDGIVQDVLPTFILLKNNGITYLIFVSLNSSSKIKNNKEVSLFITEVIKDVSKTLYGFLEKDEKDMFDTIIKIHGIGAKIAMSICSTYSPKDFYEILESKDADMLRRVPGIGLKGAKRMIVELTNSIAGLKEFSSCQKDAIGALKSLGFKEDKIRGFVLASKLTTSSSIIKDVLKKIG